MVDVCETRGLKGREGMDAEEDDGGVAEGVATMGSSCLMDGVTGGT